MTCRTESFIFFKEGVSAIQEYERLSGDYLDDDTIVALIKKKNWAHILRKMYSDLATASSDTFPMLKIITHICEIHLRHQASMLPDVVAKLSEASIIIKFWATIIEALFCETDLLVNWGDTISYGPEKTNRKMDLRILYNLENANDLINGEFGRTVKESKYFQDKEKLMANGKAQLNNLIKATKDKSMTVALILIQGLQAEFYHLRLASNGLYVLEVMKKFDFPKQSSFLGDIRDLIDGFSMLRCLCLETHEKYTEALTNSKRMSDFTSSSPQPYSPSELDWLRQVWLPPNTDSQ
jgi:hypothetical protein